MNKIEEIKLELNENIENGTGLSRDSSQFILNILENMTRTSVSKDSAPMIGDSPFKKSSKNIIVKKSKDFLDSLNYRIKK